MRNEANLIFVSMLVTACTASNGQSCASYGKDWKWDDDQPGTSETDTVAIVSTNSGTFAVAAIRPANEVRVYRVDANDMDEDPITVRFVGSVRVDAPARVTADDHAHARVTLADATTVTIDAASLSFTDSSTGNAAQPDGSVAYATGGDAWLDDERVGAPGITRAVALADVHAQTKARRVLVLQTVEPRMLVFFGTKDLTMPSAFEPLD
jgi:hypothetical protein